MREYKINKNTHSSSPTAFGMSTGKAPKSSIFSLGDNHITDLSEKAQIFHISHATATPPLLEDCLQTFHLRELFPRWGWSFSEWKCPGFFVFRFDLRDSFGFKNRQTVSLRTSWKGKQEWNWKWWERTDLRFGRQTWVGSQFRQLQSLWPLERDLRAQFLFYYFVEMGLTSA